MIHEVSGHNFHGGYTLKLRGPAEGFVLSPRQARKYYDVLCGVSGCKCGGGYGEGPSREGAAVIATEDYDREGNEALRLVPESARIAEREREAEEERLWSEYVEEQYALLQSGQIDDAEWRRTTGIK